MRTLASPLPTQASVSAPLIGYISHDNVVETHFVALSASFRLPLYSRYLRCLFIFC